MRIKDEPNKVKVEVLYNRDCHVWEKAARVLQQVLNGEGISYELHETLVTTEEEAKREKFADSPQIKINGRDIDPQASKIANYHPHGCRLYLYQGEVFQYLPKGMILDFVTQKYEGKAYENN